MRVVRSSPWILGLLLFLAPCCLTGCSEGETIPLVPSGALCERPLDPAWHQVSGVCGSDNPRAVLWPEHRMPVVVGYNGLIVESDSNRQWSAVNFGTTRDLYSLTENTDGVVVAAGSNGTVLFSPEPGQWNIEDTGRTTSWSNSCSDGQRVWLAGYDGALATTVPGQDWEFFETPDGNYLSSVCAFGDSVFVGGADGLLKVMVDGDWQDVPTPDWSHRYVRDVLHLPDGRLVVGVGVLNIRQETGWELLPELGDTPISEGMSLRDGYLWVQADNLFRIDTTVNPWQVEEFSLWYQGDDVAPGPEGQILTVNNQGRLTWVDIQPDGSLDFEMDPQGDLGARSLVRFLDGTVVFPGYLGLFQVTGTGSHLVEGLSEDLHGLMDNNSKLVGHSLDDFFILVGTNLQWCKGGAIAQEIPLHPEMGSISNLILDPAGKVWVSNNSGVACWEGTQWTFWPTTWNNTLYVTRHGTIVLQENGGQMGYFSSTGLIPIELQSGIYGVSEPEPGFLCFLNRDFQETWWQMGTGATNTRWVLPMPGCNNLNAVAGRETDDGLLVATEGYSMVVKRTENFLSNDWELVAGPCRQQIKDLQELEDGGLVALGNETGVILIYSPSPF